MKSVEDVFLEFAHAVDFGQIPVQHQDISAINSFQNSLLLQKQLTKAQSQFILKILHKYKTLAKFHGIDLQGTIDNPIWKNPFRIIDQAKRIYVEETDLGIIEIFLKFPYAYKEVFEKEFLNAVSVWDPTKSARKIKLVDANIVALNEFAVKHNLEIDESFQRLYDNVEEIWNQEEDFVPFSKIVNDTVELINADESAKIYFDRHKTGNLNRDLFLAKSMNFCLKLEEKNLSVIEKIASSKDNYFYTSDILKTLNLYKELDRPKLALIVDRASNVEEFVKHFVDQSDVAGIDRKDIKVCFRLSAEEDENKKFNNWIKDNNLNGPVAEGKIFIFSHKPAKWLFATDNEIKIIVTNSLFSSTNQITVSWVNAHPCVIFVGETTPTIKNRMPKGKNVVEL